MDRRDWDFIKQYLWDDKQFYDEKGKFIGYKENYWYLIFEDGDFIFLPQRVMEKEHFIFY